LERGSSVFHEHGFELTTVDAFERALIEIRLFGFDARNLCANLGTAVVRSPIALRGKRKAQP
jgi:hypothetical protein